MIEILTFGFKPKVLDTLEKGFQLKTKYSIYSDFKEEGIVVPRELV